MSTKSQTHWMVRAGRLASDLDRFLDQGQVSVGLDPSLRDLAPKADREALQLSLAAAHPSWTRASVATIAGMVYRFCRELKVGDVVATYDPGRRRYLLGTVRSEVRIESADSDDEPRLVRTVQWHRRAARDLLPAGALNSLGAIQTLFRLNADVSGALEGAAIAISAPEEEPPGSLGPSRSFVPPLEGAESSEGGSSQDYAELVERSQDLIADLIVRLDPYALQDLVAGVLRAMGYLTRVSPPGADRGVDIVASPDGLGLKKPRVFVQVKHRSKTAMGPGEVRALIGTSRGAEDRYLFVSTGGFTREARYEAERSTAPITLVDMQELRALVVEHYERMDRQAQALLPLGRLYWPMAPSR